MKNHSHRDAASIILSSLSSARWEQPDRHTQLCYRCGRYDIAARSPG